MRKKFSMLLFIGLLSVTIINVMAIDADGEVSLIVDESNGVEFL